MYRKPRQYEEDEETNVRVDYREVLGMSGTGDKYVKIKDTIPYLLAQGDTRRKKEEKEEKLRVGEVKETARARDKARQEEALKSKDKQKLIAELIYNNKGRTKVNRAFVPVKLSKKEKDKETKLKGELLELLYLQLTRDNTFLITRRTILLLLVRIEIKI